MRLKIVPFRQEADGTWHGKFGRFGVDVMPSMLGTYWRGPNSEVVLHRPIEAHTIAIRGQFSSSSHTLAAAFERAEILCRELYEQPFATEELHYRMTPAERDLEAEVTRAANLDAIEADRIAYERGWEMSMDLVPSLREFAEREGLLPFDAPAARPTSGTP